MIVVHLPCSFTVVHRASPQIINPVSSYRDLYVDVRWKLQIVPCKPRRSSTVSVVANDTVNLRSLPHLRSTRLR
jgi:hypothetical protein